jgi:glutamyl-tRNA synthetase
VDAIFKGMEWLGLTWDEPPVFQFSRASRHQEVARELVAKGHAYYCYCTPEELTQMKAEAQQAGLPPRYDGRWRNRDPREAPAGVAPVVRLKAPQTGETVIQDHVQGTVRVQNQQLDDMVLLRGDGTPTYMLSVVVDDHDMGITHIIRGDDHLTNAFRQTQIYQSMGWHVPEFSHIPLIHGADGAKLSKRHGALGVDAYRDMGLLPESLCNYLLRLGWGHGDDEIISREQAIQWFSLEGIGRSPSRFDMDKLLHLNGHYLRETPDDPLVSLILQPVWEKAGASSLPVVSRDVLKERLLKGMAGLKTRAKTLLELADNALFYSFKGVVMKGGAIQPLSASQKSLVKKVVDALESQKHWTEDALHLLVKEASQSVGMKLGEAAQPLRLLLCGGPISPSLFDVMAVLGKEETLARLTQAGL